MPTGPRRISWKRLDYVVHRWVGIVLGGMVAVWFISGIVLVFYPWPALTESARLALLQPVHPDDSLIHFPRAHHAAATALGAAAPTGSVAPELVGGRLTRWGGRPVYRFWSEQDGLPVPEVLVDGRTGRVLSPIDSAAAVVAARAMVADAPVSAVDRLAQGDRYMMNRDYALEFPAWRVLFDDAAATAVYVSEKGGNPFGVVTGRTRVTTWLGTVPHWLYFRWLYQRRDLWQVVSIVLASTAVLLALTGILLGVTQLLPRRQRGPRRLSPYRGVSRWHHLAGIGFGVLILTWTFSGVLQMLGGSNLPRPGQAGRVRGGAIRWDAIAISERDALSRVRREEAPVAIDVSQIGGRPGYRFRFRVGDDAWVDAASAETRHQLSATEAGAVAARVVPAAGVERIERIAAYDTYYYARAGREMHLPAWRVTLRDPARSVLYLDPVDGMPTGFVDGRTRRTRWLRDALHSMDYPALNSRPFAWRAVLLPLLAGGAISAITGVVLALRRLRQTRQPRRVPVPRAQTPSG
ncbi:PepSY domain-containing protein [soil metagenome]